jgi:3-hydroxyisobutyrate dehydrogenase-like beta-hydroxyacid dehydrogenase
MDCRPIRFGPAFPDEQTGAMTPDIALIGFGEAGATFARAGEWGARAAAYDILPQRTAHMAELGVTAGNSMSDTVEGAPLLLSLVTADAAFLAARSAAPLLAPNAIWCDMNSVAPDTKRAAARIIEAAGGRYVDVAVLAPVNPAGTAVPLLLSGSAADHARAALAALGFTNLRVVGRDIGRASAIKMIRSVMVKGIEALTAEMMLAAEAAGVAEEVLASLDASDTSKPWAEKAAYNLERMTTHGLRRAAEMEEVAKTLSAIGVAPVMTGGTIQRQREMAEKTNERNAA